MKKLEMLQEEYLQTGEPHRARAYIKALEAEREQLLAEKEGAETELTKEKRLHLAASMHWLEESKKLARAEKRIKELEEALTDCITRMDRARKVLVKGQLDLPSWLVLDTKSPRLALQGEEG